MNRDNGFTLIELLISLSISSFIILGMMQGYRNAIKFVERAQQVMVLNRKVSLLFNQMERDFTTAFIPLLAQQEKMPEPEDQKQDQNNKKKQAEKETDGPQDEEEKEKKKKEQQQSYFFAEIIEDAAFPHQHKKYELLKRITFIATNPLQVYGEKKKRLVRIAYELEKDKEQSKPDKPIYKLLRKETFDIFNAAMKQSDPLETNEASSPVKTHVIADMIKAFSIECSMPKNQKSKQNDRSPEQPLPQESDEKEIVTFSWGNAKKETHGMVPQQVVISLWMWSEKLNDSLYFSCSIPILAFNEKKETPTEKSDTSGKEKYHEASQAQESNEEE